MKVVGIFELLKWAYVMELPKIGARGASVSGSAWDSIAQFAALGTVVDTSPNGYGVIAGFIDEGEPHPDAVKVGQAVKALGDRGGWDVPAGWQPFPDWADKHGLVADEVARIIEAEDARGTMNGRQVVNLVVTCAALGRGPDWRADEPAAVMMTRSGRPAWFIREKRVDKLSGKIEEIETDGFDARRQRPKPGAYRRYRLERSIRGDVVGRLEWQLFQSALEVLAEELSGRLESHQIAPFFPNRAPWRTDPTRVGSRQAV